MWLRESMTRSGVVEFQVQGLVARQQGTLVMMDLTTERGAHVAPQHGAQIMRHAMARFDIAVSSVYWRRERVGPPAAGFPGDRGIQAACSPVYKTIEVDELAAFMRRAAPLRTPPAQVPQRQRSRFAERQTARLVDTQLTES
jgi:hypothetical protein